MSMSYGQLTSVLTKAFQEEEKKIERLQAEKQDLKMELLTIKAMIEKLAQQNSSSTQLLKAEK